MNHTQLKYNKIKVIEREQHGANPERENAEIVGLDHAVPPPGQRSQDNQRSLGRTSLDMWVKIIINPWATKHLLSSIASGACLVLCEISLCGYLEVRAAANGTNSGAKAWSRNHGILWITRTLSHFCSKIVAVCRQNNWSSQVSYINLLMLIWNAYDWTWKSCLLW